jgi:putative phosphoesterase
MKIGVMSDIHGNCVALDAVLADVEGHPVDRWVCLGDALQGGPQPAQVAHRLHELGCPVILGNADEFVRSGTVGEPNTDEMNEVRAWTLAELGEDATFIDSFLTTHGIELGDGRRMLCFHGSPSSNEEVLLPETDPNDLRAALGDEDIQCGGHTHMQWTAMIDGRMFFNPGSVGLAYNRHQPGETFRFSPWAEFAVVHDDRIEFCKVPFDVGALKRATLQSGHPAAERLVRQY